MHRTFAAVGALHSVAKINHDKNFKILAYDWLFVELCLADVGK